MRTTRVLVDANVLYSKTCRDWLIMIQLGHGPYTVYWTEDIVSEALYHLRRSHPTWDGGVIAMVRKQIVDSLEGGRVEDFVVDGTFLGGDVNDQHVHAAALACQASIVLTSDKGFSSIAAPDSLPYEVYEPDDFFLLTDDSSPDVVRQVAHEQAAHLFRRNGSSDLPARLRSAKCPGFADRVRRHLQTIDLTAEAVSTHPS